MPVRTTSADATAKWLANLSNAQSRMQSGAMRVTEAPGQKAAAAADKWLAKVTQAKAKFASRVSSVTLQEWQQAYINVGIPRVSQGAQAKQQKFTAFLDQFLPYLASGLQQIDKMPSVTVEDGVARASAMIRWNAKFKRT